MTPFSFSGRGLTSPQCYHCNWPHGTRRRLHQGALADTKGPPPTRAWRRRAQWSAELHAARIQPAQQPVRPTPPAQLLIGPKSPQPDTFRQPNICLLIGGSCLGGDLCVGILLSLAFSDSRNYLLSFLQYYTTTSLYTLLWCNGNTIYERDRHQNGFSVPSAFRMGMGGWLGLGNGVHRTGIHGLGSIGGIVA